MKKYDCLVVGAGFAGATIANVLAEHGKKVLLIDKRSHVGGNAFDFYDDNGILVHLYGPHIFHTNYKNVFDYITRFGEFEVYKHRVLGNINGVLVPIPFNFTSLEKLLPEKAKSLEKILKEEYPQKYLVSVLDLLDSPNQEIQEFGKYVFENVFVHYTAKQWGINIEKIDKSVINRVPVILGYGDLYFSDTYQCMPKNGFTEIFNKMLENKNIEVRLNTPAKEVLYLKDGTSYLLNEIFTGPIVYTGDLESLFDFKYNMLSYRSLRLEFEQLNITSFQNASVVNYPVSEEFTRITEFKYLTNQKIEGKTTILKEYPQIYDGDNIPYYPIQNEENVILYGKYKSLADQYKNLFLCGRLAEYKYYNMDAVINKALELADILLKKY